MNELWWQDEYGLKGLELPAGATVVENGANVGVFSWLLLNRFPEIEVHAVEPHPTNFSALKTNLAPWADRVRFYQTAVGECDGKLEMFVPDWLDGVRTDGVAGPWHTDPMWRPAGLVESIRLSTLLQKGGIGHIALLKIDIEGAEEELLPEFSAGILTNVESIIMEVHDFEHTGLVKEFDITLRSGGFSTRFKRVAEDRHLLWACKE
jgi:FkbM family methyltransferase